MKKIKIIMTIVLFGLSFLAHYIYTWFPNFITSIFFPVNESIWEHMKIIYTCILIGSIIEFIIYKTKGIKVNNFYINILITSISSIILYLAIYLPLEDMFSHNTFIAISLLLIIFIISQIISYYILNLKEIPNQKIIGFILIILSYMFFTYLTYYPLYNDLFIDKQTNKYGIK